MVNRTLFAKTFRLGAYVRLFGQAIQPATIRRNGLKNGVLSHYAANRIFPGWIRSRLRLTFDELIYVLKMTLAAQLHQGISNDILPSSIGRSVRHGSES